MFQYLLPILILPWMLAAQPVEYHHPQSYVNVGESSSNVKLPLLEKSGETDRYVEKSEEPTHAVGFSFTVLHPEQQFPKATRNDDSNDLVDAEGRSYDRNEYQRSLSTYQWNSQVSGYPNNHGTNYHTNSGLYSSNSPIFGSPLHANQPGYQQPLVASSSSNDWNSNLPYQQTGSSSGAEWNTKLQYQQPVTSSIHDNQLGSNAQYRQPLTVGNRDTQWDTNQRKAVSSSADNPAASVVLDHGSEQFKKAYQVGFLAGYQQALKHQHTTAISRHYTAENRLSPEWVNRYQETHYGRYTGTPNRYYPGPVKAG